MASPSSCSRCFKPLALLSASGLCPECAATDAEAAAPTPPNHPFASDTSASTRTADYDGTTATGNPEGENRPMPIAPAGYELLERLGGGGMGDVYLAREQATDRLVAMKFVRHAGDPEALARFLVELRILAGLDHPNIVRVLSSDFLRADPFFTMEHMAGGSLSDRIKTGSPIPIAEAVRLIRTVCDALTVTHAREVIHRDLKPSNILLTVDGTPKVSDFGLAKRLENDDQLTVASGALGTPSYMPPEQISRKNGDIGPWSDVYGLGATLYHVLTGRAPFVGEALEIITQVLADPPERPTRLRAEIPKALEGIVLKCLEKDPKDRYQTVAELAADLDRYTAGRKPVAPTLTPWRRLKRWTKRNRRVVAAGVAAVVVVVGLVAAGWSFGQERTQRDNPPPEDPVGEAQNTLAEGKEVILVPEKGLPRWHEWRLTPATLGPGPLPNTGCAFQTNDSTLLVLSPDPGVERYRFSVELSHLRQFAKTPGQVDHVGIFFGCETREATQSRRVTVLVGGTYFDVLRPQPAGNPPLKNHARVEGGFLLESSRRLPQHFTSAEGTAGPFPPPDVFPGPWRRFVVDVTPEIVRIWWYEKPEDPAVKPKLLHEWTGEQLRDYYTKFGPQIDRHVPGHGLNGPAVWRPRMALGVWAYQSSVAVRKATLSPIPP